MSWLHFSPGFAISAKWTIPYPVKPHIWKSTRSSPLPLPHTHWDLVLCSQDCGFCPSPHTSLVHLNCRLWTGLLDVTVYTILLKTLQLLPNILEETIKGNPSLQNLSLFPSTPNHLMPHQCSTILVSFHLHIPRSFLLLRTFAFTVPSARNAFPSTPLLAAFILQKLALMSPPLRSLPWLLLL